MAGLIDEYLKTYILFLLLIFFRCPKWPLISNRSGGFLRFNLWWLGLIFLASLLLGLGGSPPSPVILGSRFNSCDWFFFWLLNFSYSTFFTLLLIFFANGGETEVKCIFLLLFGWRVRLVRFWLFFIKSSKREAPTLLLRLSTIETPWIIVNFTIFGLGVRRGSRGRKIPGTMLSLVLLFKHRDSYICQSLLLAVSERVKDSSDLCWLSSHRKRCHVW